MHILAGLDKPTSGSVGIAGTEITTLGDNELTKLRREHIGFVFQFFNLLPMLDAKENILLPLTIAGEKPESGWFDQLVADVGLGDRLSHRPAELSGGQQQRVAIARALVSKPTVALRGRADGQPRLDDERARSSSSCAARSTSTARRSSWSRTTPARRPSAHRVLFLADGEIVRELGECDAHRIHRGDGRGRGRVIKVALRGLAGRKLRAVLTGIAIVLGVAMISGTYILTDTVQSAFTNLLIDSYAGTDAVVTGKGLDISIDGEKPPSPPVDASLLDDVRGVDGVALATGSVLDEETHEDPHPRRRGGQHRGVADARHSASTPIRRTPGSTRSTSTRAVGPRPPTRSSSMRGRRTSRGTRSATRCEISTLQPKRPFKLVGVAQYGEVESLGGISFVVFTIPAAQELLGREGQYDAISVAAREGRHRGRAGGRPSAGLSRRTPRS